jgi:hypothetical protein
MEITMKLSDEVGTFLQNLPYPNDFVSELVKDAFKNHQLPSSKVPEPSKWAKIVQRVQNDPVHLAGYSQQLKKDMKEFRENFEFLHDHEKISVYTQHRHKMSFFNPLFV